MENSISMCLPLYGGTRQIVMKVILANQLKYGNSMIMNLVALHYLCLYRELGKSMLALQ